jgi:stalled ribosome rescue protein Dom34
LAGEGAEIKRISSELKENIRFAGGAQKESAEEHGDNRLNGQLNDYYDEVAAHILQAESILIFGPGEAKIELKKRLKNMDFHGHIVGIETVDKMTDNQIVVKVRQYFLN